MKKELKPNDVINITITGTTTKVFSGVSAKYYTTEEGLFVKVGDTDYEIGSTHNVIVKEFHSILYVSFI